MKKIYYIFYFNCENNVLCSICKETNYKLLSVSDESKAKAKSPKDASKNKKVMPENAADNLYVLTPVKQNIPKASFDSPQNESSDSFSYLPLCERIKIISENVPKKESLESPTMGRNVGLYSSEASISIINEATSPEFLISNMNKKTSFCIDVNRITPQDTNVEFLTDEFSELQIRKPDPIKESLSSSGLSTNANNQYPCLEFSDSDDSSADILQNDIKSSFNVSCRSSRRMSVLANNTELISDDSFSISYFPKHQVELLSPSMNNHVRTPKFVYSIAESSTKSIMNSVSSDKKFNLICNSTPKLNLRKSLLQKIIHLSDTKQSPMYCNDSLKVYSPIIFDSSNDDTI